MLAGPEGVSGGTGLAAGISGRGRGREKTALTMRDSEQREELEGAHHGLRGARPPEIRWHWVAGLSKEPGRDRAGSARKTAG